MAMSVTYSNFGGRLIHENRGGVETEYVGDPLGSLVMAMDTSQNVVYTAEYWPYGEVQTEAGANPTSWSFVGLLGYFKDLASLLYVRARHYRPNLTQWQTLDPLWPIELPFSYTTASPVSDVDSTGLFCTTTLRPCGMSAGKTCRQKCKTDSGQFYCKVLEIVCDVRIPCFKIHTEDYFTICLCAGKAKQLTCKAICAIASKAFCKNLPPVVCNFFVKSCEDACNATLPTPHKVKAL